MAADPDEQLSTGEAAKLLNSRQHVVDLCNGLLPYTTTGTHRRLRPARLWLAHATAGQIVTNLE